MPQGLSAHRPTAYPARPEASTTATGLVPQHPQARGQENAPDQRGLFSQPGTAPPEPPLHRDQLVAAEPRTAAQPAPPRTRRPPPAGSSTTRENWPFCASRGSADLPPQARRIRRYAPNVRFRPPGGCLPSVTEIVWGADGDRQAWPGPQPTSGGAVGEPGGPDDDPVQVAGGDQGFLAFPVGELGAQPPRHEDALEHEPPMAPGITGSDRRALLMTARTPNGCGSGWQVQDLTWEDCRRRFSRL